MDRKTFTLGFSTCPNDTYIFYALMNKKIDLRGMKFEVFLADVEVLNRKAIHNELDITKMSMFAYTSVASNYKILDSGSAIGFNNGPLIIAKKMISLSELKSVNIAIPGVNTTANLLLSTLFPEITKKTEIIFSDIASAIEKDLVDAGLIIHETRFTYERHGFVKIADLGQLWEHQTGKPIPLGCIAVNRSINEEDAKVIDLLIRESLEYANEHPEEALAFCKEYAQDISNDVMNQHIKLYVNVFSKSLGEVGRDAIRFLYKKASLMGIFPEVRDDIFV